MSSTESYPGNEFNPGQLKRTFETISEFQTQASSSKDEFAIDSSVEIAPITNQIYDNRNGIAIERLDHSSSVSQRELHRMRKVCEVYENRWQFRLPSEPLWKAAQTAGTVSQLGGILISLKGVHEASSAIKSVYDSDGRHAVTNEQIDDFYLSSGVLFGELVLMATPVSSQFAFQATGRLHSYVLWHRFKNYRSVYRLLMHHIYYILEGIPSLAIHEAGSNQNIIEAFVDSIIYIIQTSWSVFDEPSFLHDLTDVNLSRSFIDGLFEITLDDIQNEIGERYEELENYVSSILQTLETHYNNLYEQYIDTSSRDIIRRVIQKLLDII